MQNHNPRRKKGGNNYKGWIECNKPEAYARTLNHEFQSLVMPTPLYYSDSWRYPSFFPPSLPFSLLPSLPFFLTSSLSPFFPPYFPSFLPPSLPPSLPSLPSFLPASFLHFFISSFPFSFFSLSFLLSLFRMWERIGLDLMLGMQESFRSCTQNIFCPVLWIFRCKLGHCKLPAVTRFSTKCKTKASSVMERLLFSMVFL